MPVSVPEDFCFVCNFKEAYNSRYINVDFNTFEYTATMYENSWFVQMLKYGMY